MSVCENCQGDIETFCTSNDPFAGYEGAFECMASANGEVAFVRHTTIGQSTANNSRSDTVSAVIITFGQSWLMVCI